MSKILLDSAMFYPGYPAYIVMLKNADGEILCPTHSSSFAIGRRLVLGMGEEDDASTFYQLKVGAQLSVNYLSAEEGIFSDSCGFNRRGRLDALIAAGGIIVEKNGVPTLENAPLTLIGEVKKLENFGRLHLVYVSVRQYLVADALVTADGKFDFENFSVLHYFGAQKARKYIETSAANGRDKGSYLKEARRKAREARKQGEAADDTL